MSKLRKAIYVVSPIFICFLIGFLSHFFQENALETWYPSLNKPQLTPPDTVFPIAWFILYICMGISVGLIIISKNRKKGYFIFLFIIQLILNLMWSISFFYLQSPLWGFINIILLDGIVIRYTLHTYTTEKISSILFFPYVAWILFATYLNFYILINN